MSGKELLSHTNWITHKIIIPQYEYHGNLYHFKHTCVLPAKHLAFIQRFSMFCVCTSASIRSGLQSCYDARQRREGSI